MLARLAAPLVACALAGCSGGPRVPASLPHPLAGEVAPELGEVPGLGLSAADATRATVVDFWASWCEACRESMPALDALWRERREDGLVVVGVSEDDDEAVAKRTARALGASFPQIFDRDQGLAAGFRVGSLPLTFVLDGAGVVRWVGRDPALARRAAIALLGPRP
jgi:cytochrome c biogenesis protein CcmG/thiol:disulfide interchange protein DsbE